MPADDVNRIEEQYIGQLCRLEIPLKSVVNLRRVAEELRGLAFRLDGLSRSDATPSQAMLEVKGLVRRCNHRLDAIRGRGRPKRSRHHY